jgi:hypothetical protein
MTRASHACIAVAVAPVILFGCETVSSQTSDGRPMPPPAHEPEQAPVAAPINAISVLYAPKPADTDANGRPDRLTVELYLFARPYPTPVWREGTVFVSAYPLGKAGSPSAPGTKPVHAWSFTTRELELGRFRSLIGEGYRFDVSLLDNGGSDLVKGSGLDFITSFQPAGSKDRVWGDGVRSIDFTPMQTGEVR